MCPKKREKNYLLAPMPNKKTIKAAKKPRNPVARSPLLKKGGAHQKSEQALRKAANDALRRQLKKRTSE